MDVNDIAAARGSDEQLAGRGTTQRQHATRVRSPPSRDKVPGNGMFMEYFAVGKLKQEIVEDRRGLPAHSVCRKNNERRKKSATWRFVLL
jgi:hypothetical protein